MLNIFSKKDDLLLSHKKKIEEAVRKSWPKEEFLVEELIFHNDGTDNDFQPQIDNKTKTDSPQPANSSLLVAKKSLIFIDKELDVDWITNYTLNQCQIDQISSVACVEAVPHKHLPREEIMIFKRILGSAILSTIEGSLTEATKQRENAQLYINKRIIERSRIWTISFAGLLVLPVILLLVHNLALLNEPNLTGYNIMLLTILSGILGTFLSLVQRTGSEAIDSSSGKLLHFLEVSAKFIAGGLFGLFSYHIAKSEISPEMIQKMIVGTNGIIVLAFISGFSERFIPRFISKYEANMEEV